MLITLTFYLGYLILVLGRNHLEYRATLDLELKLKLLEQQSQLDLPSRTDSLTQLGNRYQFNNLLPSQVANAVRQGEPLSLVLMDIDFFKEGQRRTRPRRWRCLPERLRRTHAQGVSP